MLDWQSWILSKFVPWLLASGGAVIVGSFIAGWCRDYLRELIDPGSTKSGPFLTPEPKANEKCFDLILGGVERTVATTLVVIAPPLLPGFVGAWIALKLAAHWQRRTELDQQIVARKTLAALLANAASFFVAIIAGLIINSRALETWAS